MTRHGNPLSAIMLVLLVLSPAWAQHMPTQEKGLLGHWKFDEGQSDVAADSSGNGFDGDLYDAEWVRGPFGVALRFNGEEAYVQMPEIPALNGSDELTVEAWVFWEGTGRYPNILTGGRWSPGGFLIFVSDTTCSFRMGRPGASAAQPRSGWTETSAKLVSPIEFGRWYHLAATFKRPRIQTYVNGELVGSANWDFPVGHAGDLIIGTWTRKPCHNGLIDEVKIYKRELSQDEVKASYQSEGRRRVVAASAKAYEKIPPEASREPAALTLENSSSKLLFDKRLRAIGLLDKRTGQNYLASPSTFVTARLGSRRQRPSSFKSSATVPVAGSSNTYSDVRLTVEFGGSDVKVDLAARATAGYFMFEVIGVNREDVDEVAFVNLTAHPSKYVNLMSGLAGDDERSVCLRCLNLQTWPTVSGSPPVLRATGTREYGLKGAKAALVACSTDLLLPTLQDLMRRENVPHSPFGGPFALTAPINRLSYIFTQGLSERNVDEWISMAQTSAMPIVHLCDWAETLGRYEPKKAYFPRGMESLKATLDAIHGASLLAGMHTLSGGMTARDAFVSPTPDKRLSKDRAFTLSEAVGENDTVLPLVENPSGLDTVWAYSGRGNAVQIDDEIIQYRGLSDKPPYGLTQCVRAAFGTKVQAHAKGAPVHHLFVRYGLFQPDQRSTLVDDVAECIARAVNACGFDLIYHDGAEGMPAGAFGASRMRTAIVNRFRRPLRVESSWSVLHHLWPFHSCVGAWDHPLWGVKYCVDQHCASNERYERASLMPAQLGWWALFGANEQHDAEWPDEVEYLCAKALGHDWSLSFQTLRPGSQAWNARQDEYLRMIGRYEKLRLSGYFSAEVKAKLREPRAEFHLAQAQDGEWQFLPADYLTRKFAALADGRAEWTVENRFAAQTVGIRIQALYSAGPYDGAESLVVADFSKPDEFRVAGAASGVTHTFSVTSERVKAGPASGRFSATSRKADRRGTWALAAKSFSPWLDMRPHRALGVWVHGDGKGEVLNFQLRNPALYHSTYDDHCVDVDFTGWRYFELLLRERDAQRHADYDWPYHSAMNVCRSPLDLQHVDALNIYVNNLPPNGEVTCDLSPVKALPVVKTRLSNPSLTIGGKRIVFPVTLESGQYIEFNSLSDCTLRDEGGGVLAQVTPQGDAPRLAQSKNPVAFACQPSGPHSCRANVTLVAHGEPLRGMAQDKPHLKAKLRQLDQYALAVKSDGAWSFVRQDAKVVRRLDGRDNVWTLESERPEEREITELRLVVGDAIPGVAYEQASAIEDFEDAARWRPAGQYAEQVIGPGKSGCAKQGVAASFALSPTDVKDGRSCAVLQAESTLGDRSGWCAAVRKFSPAADLSAMKGLGLWVRGDGKGAYLKVQLCDAAGSRCDYYVRLDFAEWRYVELVQPALGEIDKSRVEFVLFYLVGLPAKGTTTCRLDGLRALRDIPVRQVAYPHLKIDDQVLAFPATLRKGSVLTLKPTGECAVRDPEGQVQPLKPSARLPQLQPGRSALTFTCEGALDNVVKVTVTRK